MMMANFLLSGIAAHAMGIAPDAPSGSAIVGLLGRAAGFPPRLFLLAISAFPFRRFQDTIFLREPIINAREIPF
jgi:hypothetical protein